MNYLKKACLRPPGSEKDVKSAMQRQEGFIRAVDQAIGARKIVPMAQEAMEVAKEAGWELLSGPLNIYCRAVM
jgi:hypothetical protein